jgi:hypothetical protein
MISDQGFDHSLCGLQKSLPLHGLCPRQHSNAALVIWTLERLHYTTIYAPGAKVGTSSMEKMEGIMSRGKQDEELVW